MLTPCPCPDSQAAQREEWPNINVVQVLATRHEAERTPVVRPVILVGEHTAKNRASDPTRIPRSPRIRGSGSEARILWESDNTSEPWIRGSDSLAICPSLGSEARARFNEPKPRIRASGSVSIYIYIYIYNDILKSSYIHWHPTGTSRLLAPSVLRPQKPL